MAKYDSLKKKNNIGPPLKTRVDRVGDDFRAIAKRLESIGSEVHDAAYANKINVEVFYAQLEKVQLEVSVLHQIAATKIR